MEKRLQKIMKKTTVEQRMVWGALLSLVFLFGLYGYFLNATIINIAQERTANRNLEKMTGEISELEHRYISINSKLDIEYAKKIGFYQVHDANYVRRLDDRVLTFAQ